MSEHKHIARPYAKAVFDIAKDSNTLDGWLELLHNLVFISNDQSMVELINAPSTTNEQLSNLILSILGSDLSSEQTNYVKVLTVNERLLISKEIYGLYNALKLSYENIKQVTIESAFAVDDQFEASIRHKLEGKFGCKVEIANEINPDLLGGAIIRTDNLIIDGSIANKISRLKQNLLA